MLDLLQPVDWQIWYFAAGRVELVEVEPEQEQAEPVRPGQFEVVQELAELLEVLDLVQRRALVVYPEPNQLPGEQPDYPVLLQVLGQHLPEWVGVVLQRQQQPYPCWESDSSGFDR